MTARRWLLATLAACVVFTAAPVAAEQTIRLIDSPRWSRARNDTGVLLGGDIRLTARAQVVNEAGVPMSGVDLSLYARGEGPMATGRGVTDRDGIASMAVFFPIPPGLAVSVIVCLADDPAACSPQATVGLRQRFVASADVRVVYTMVPSPARPEPADLDFCTFVKDCDPFIRLGSPTALNVVDTTVVARGRFNLTEASRRGSYRAVSLVAELPVTYQRHWATTYYGAQAIDSAAGLGDYSVSAEAVHARGVVRVGFNGRSPHSVTALGAMRDLEAPRAARTQADGFDSLEMTAQIGRALGVTTVFGGGAVSRAFDRTFTDGARATRGLVTTAWAGVTMPSGGGRLRISPWVGYSKQQATRLIHQGTDVIVQDKAWVVLAGFEVGDVRGGPLPAAVGVTASGFSRSSLNVTAFLRVDIRQLFAVR